MGNRCDLAHFFRKLFPTTTLQPASMLGRTIRRCGVDVEMLHEKAR
jgi:hypothetical protein